MGIILKPSFCNDTKCPQGLLRPQAPPLPPYPNLDQAKTQLSRSSEVAFNFPAPTTGSEREAGARWRGRAHRCSRRPRDAPPARPWFARARRSPTSSKFNRYLNPKGNEQTSGIGCQGIFSFVGRIYPQVFPQQVISGPRRRFRSADAVASGPAPGRPHRGPGIHGCDGGATLPKQATGLGCPRPEGPGALRAACYQRPPLPSICVLNL